MEQIKTKPYVNGSEKGETWYREFELPRDFTVKDFEHLIWMATDEFDHHEMRVGYENGSFEEILTVDHA